MIYETLIETDQAKINAMVSSIKEHLTIEGIVDVDLLMAILERLNEVKKEARADEKLRQEKIREDQRKNAAEMGRKYVATLKEGDMITFIYGSAGYTRTATLPIDKVGPNSVQVTYTPDMLGPTSKTPRRNILFSKIVVPDSFAEVAA